MYKHARMPTDETEGMKARALEDERWRRNVAPAVC